jgi:hypothetical protein
LIWIQKLFGAPLLYCAPCRIQFYDLRPRRRPKKRRESDGTAMPEIIAAGSDSKAEESGSEVPVTGRRPGHGTNG